MPHLLGPDTAKYLDDKAAESFKRQVDLEESIWRSLPLFTGALIAAAALLAKIASLLPPPEFRPFSMGAYVFLCGSTCAFGASSWWLWQVVRPRDFDFPASDEAIADYANSLNAYHSDRGLEGKELDAIVLGEMRSYMTVSLGSAAKSSFAHNQARLSARSQVLVLLMLGFVLSFVSGAWIYAHSLLAPPRGTATVTHVRTAKPENTAVGARRSRLSRSEAPGASPNASNSRRRMDHQDKHRRPDQDQVNERRHSANADADGKRAQSDGQAVRTSDAAPNEDGYGRSAGACERDTARCSAQEVNSATLETKR